MEKKTTHTNRYIYIHS